MPKPRKRTENRTVVRFVLHNGKYVSPESYFIRTGKIPPGMDSKKAKILGTRFLSRKWFDTASNGNPRLPLPTFRQRIHGGTHSKVGRAEIEKQAGFALGVFGRHLSRAEKERAMLNVKKMLTKRILSIGTVIRENTFRTNLTEMRKSGKEFFNYVKAKPNAGEIYPALTKETTGKVYFAKGWNSKGNKEERTAPIHEVIHILQKNGIIRTAVPFAQAADRLYGLENGILKPEKLMRAPTREEFDRKPKTEKRFGEKFPNYESEPDWVYQVGDRIGQWAYLSLPKEKRWDYLYLRCIGRSHAEAIKGTGGKKV
ncbi:MAG: hypothetical protein WC602_01345 [archaeon]